MRLPCVASTWVGQTKTWIAHNSLSPSGVWRWFTHSSSLHVLLQCSSATSWRRDLVVCERFREWGRVTKRTGDRVNEGEREKTCWDHHHYTTLAEIMVNNKQCGKQSNNPDSIWWKPVLLCLAVGLIRNRVFINFAWYNLPMLHCHQTGKWHISVTVFFAWGRDNFTNHIHHFQKIEHILPQSDLRACTNVSRLYWEKLALNTGNY